MTTSPNEARSALRHLFERHRIADRQAVAAVLQTQARMTIFRHLSKLDYLSSYTHAGAYYTLKSIPAFDGNGLWRYKDVGFSRHGTLKQTVVHLVETSEAGWFHREMQALVGVRVHNTLLDLVGHKHLCRELVTGEYLYVSADVFRAAAQVERRRLALAAQPLDLARVVDVLVAVIQAPKDDARAIAARLQAGGIDVSVEQVEEIFVRYGVVKKTARSRSRRSPR